MTEPPKETPESRAARRRWITVGEFVAVAGLLIAALSLYLTWSDRRADEAERRAQQAYARESAAEQARRVGLIATDADGDLLSFKGAACDLQSADISFPSALEVPAQSVTLDPHIDADWFDGPLLKAFKSSKRSSGRLPVLIVSRCTGASGERLERAIYDVPFTVESRLLRGKTLRLRGLVLREYVSAGKAQARLDAAWRAATRGDAGNMS
jgi:type II secretory pathway pseudopilin PulG